MTCLHVEYNVEFYDYVYIPSDGRWVQGPLHHRDTVFWGHFVDDPHAPGVLERAVRRIREAIWGNAPLNFKNECWAGRKCVYTGATIKGYQGATEFVELNIPVQRS